MWIGVGLTTNTVGWAPIPVLVTVADLCMLRHRVLSVAIYLGFFAAEAPRKVPRQPPVYGQPYNMVHIENILVLDDPPPRAQHTGIGVSNDAPLGLFAAMSLLHTPGTLDNFRPMNEDSNTVASPNSGVDLFF